MLVKFFQKIDDALSFLLGNNCNEKRLLKKIFKNKNIIAIDIGSNNGNYSNFLINEFNIKKLFCIEPQNNLVQKLESTFKNNSKVKIIQKALSNKEMWKKFYTYKVNSSSGFYKLNNFYKSLNTISSVSKIRTTTFDQIFNKNMKIDICKIDVEGEDFNVLQGMKKNLKKNIKLLKLELFINSMHLSSSGNYLNIINYLNQFNFKLLTISKAKYYSEKVLYIDAYFIKNSSFNKLNK